jgi:hypothetical protein
MADDNRRAETAREHDDSDIIDSAEPAPGQGGREGGNLQRDVGTQDAKHRVDDPENSERVTKQDDIDNDAAYPSDRPRGV